MRKDCGRFAARVVRECNHFKALAERDKKEPEASPHLSPWPDASANTAKGGL